MTGFAAGGQPGGESDALRAAAETMAAVRDGCVWSQQITHRALVPYLLEESAEVIDAVESGDRTELREELGDLLWQVLFHSAIAAEHPDDPFTIDDVARTVTEKMVRRHPHVFADEVAIKPDEVLVHWNAAKAAEKRTRTSALDGIPHSMPALARAQKVVGRAGGVVGPATDIADERALGELLLSFVAVAQANGWDAERALRERVRELEAEVRTTEVRAAGHADTEA